MVIEKEPFWTSLAVLNTTRDRIKNMRQRIKGIGNRKNLETIDEVVVRLIDFYDENGGEALEREQSSVK